MLGGLPYTFAGPLPEGTRVTPAKLLADDQLESSAVLYEPAGERARVVVVIPHPRVEFARHYAIPGLVGAGFAALGHNSRYLNNDIEISYDRLLLDVAAALRWVKARGFERVVLLGNSGGGTLCATALAKPAVPIDGIMVVAAHAGEGRCLLRSIDPSVTDEADPLSCDPALDMFNPDNGYDLATRTARYAPEFLARYRPAQRARVERLDAVASAAVAEDRAARAELAARPPAAPYQLLRQSRVAIPNRLLVIYRTVANPAYLDLSVDANERDVGSIFGILGGRPEFGNYFNLNIARVLAPRAWLSVWSGISGKADFLSTASKVTVPALFVAAAGESEVPPSESDAMWNALASPDKTRHDVAGADHYLRPTRRGGRQDDPRDELLRVMTGWLGERFR